MPKELFERIIQFGIQTVFEDTITYAYMGNFVTYWPDGPITMWTWRGEYYALDPIQKSL